MSPSEYIAKHYLNDLQFLTEMDTSDCLPGPCGMLCGWTIPKLLEPKSRCNFIDPAAFTCVTYGLNLINQGIYTYFREAHFPVIFSLPPFLDARGCSHVHGGATHSPSWILGAVRRNHDPIPLDEVPAYLSFLFFQYLPEIIASEKLSLNVDELVACLLRDPDCQELAKYL